MAEIIRKTSDLWVMRQFLKEEIGKKQYPIHLINPTHQSNQVLGIME